MLDRDRHLTTFTEAPKGHVVLTAQLRLRHGRSTDLVLGFAQNQQDALHIASAAVGERFGHAWRHYESQWLRYDGRLRRPSSSLGFGAIRAYYESVNVVKASEDKQFPGAIAAGLASPWGQAVPAGNLSNGKPTYFVMGTHHAREWPAGEIAMEFAWHLVNNYGTDPQITSLLKRERVVIVPIDRLEHLVGLLEHERLQRVDGLLAIPWTAFR